MHVARKMWGEPTGHRDAMSNAHPRKGRRTSQRMTRTFRCLDGSAPLSQFPTCRSLPPSEGHNRVPVNKPKSTVPPRKKISAAAYLRNQEQAAAISR
jgi:hypothetical protein